MECANKNGYSVIRILQDDVMYDKTTWREDLEAAIELVKNQKEPVNILIGDLYKNHPIYEINHVYL